MSPADPNKPALGRALARPRYEIMPVRGGLEAAQGLFAGAVASVTCSPALGMDGSLDFALGLKRLGLRVIPHLAARRIRDSEHLTSILERMAAAAVRDVFVVAGDDTDTPGAYASGLELIRDLHESGAKLDSIGVPCYPEGHAFIEDGVLEEALVCKADYAHYMVTQLCFDAPLIRRWLHHIRGLGVSLPVHIGIPGVIERRRLMGIAMRIGLGDSVRFLRRNMGLAGGFLGPGRYAPDRLLRELTDCFAEPTLGVEGIHVNTFNQVQATEDWRRQWLDALASAGGGFDHADASRREAPH